MASEGWPGWGWKDFLTLQTEHFVLGDQLVELQTLHVHERAAVVDGGRQVREPLTHEPSWFCFQPSLVHSSSDHIAAGARCGGAMDEYWRDGQEQGLYGEVEKLSQAHAVQGRGLSGLAKRAA